MRMIVAIAAAATLAGCAKGFFASHSTSFSERSDKPALAYVQCLEPKWQAPGTTTSKIKTPTGYTLEVSTPHTGPVALAVVNEAPPGSDVDIFLPTAQGRAERWEDLARTCLTAAAPGK
ncbi:hypothetical protein [Pseudomonas sp. NPDC089534]|uniref:hypothetical protein n=1 Tax=Pseudomonas sp. NPDC089534 TaxID=3364468 RepID=UPI00381A841A